jgi:hypothetical protein
VSWCFIHVYADKQNKLEVSTFGAYIVNFG